VDEGIEVLTGVEAGQPDGDGRFPEGSVNARVAQRLAELARRYRDFTPGGTERSREETPKPPAPEAPSPPPPPGPPSPS
jgi:hypothetical protein